MTFIERFWTKVDRRGPEDCWPWLGYLDRAGYGTFHYRRRALYAHRAMLEFTNGLIMPGLQVAHTCDQPSCVNPAHLVITDQWGNQQDMKAKGRGRGPQTVKHWSPPKPRKPRVRYWTPRLGSALTAQLQLYEMGIESKSPPT